MTNFANILIVRTDRIGDVVLTTPVIKALREAYPAARISMLVAPATRELVDGDMRLDEVLTDDRGGEHRGLGGFLRLVGVLRRRRFDCALIFHTKRRTNLACFCAGIPVRVGYKNDKFGFLLNRPIEDTRHHGDKHEAQYCLDVLRVLGIESTDLDVHIPVKEEALRWADRFRREHGLGGNGKVIVVHPGASDPSKQWTARRFAELITALYVRYAGQIILIGAAGTEEVSQEIASLTRHAVIDLTGKTSVGQMAGLLTQSDLLISNDSGPVHVAAGVGTPVVSIFTRNQPGINPERWRPLGPKARVVCVSPDQSREISFTKSGPAQSEYLELIPAEAVLEAVDSLWA